MVKMFTVNPDNIMHPDYCIICQEWQTNHSSYSCPDLICKYCNMNGHAKIACPQFLNTIFGLKEDTKEVKDIKVKPEEDENNSVSVEKTPLDYGNSGFRKTRIRRARPRGSVEERAAASNFQC